MPAEPNRTIRPARFEVPEFAEELPFEVADYTGEERLSQLYRFQIDLLAEDPDVDFAKLVNQEATLVAWRGREAGEAGRLNVHGIIADVQQGGRTAGWYGYRAVLVPHMWRLSLTHQSRIFQNVTVVDVVRQVMGEHGLDRWCQFNLEASYPVREYVVQYQETDLNFVQRLLEHEGIWFFFSHQEAPSRVVFTDNARGSLPIDGGETTVPYHAGAGLGHTAEAVREFICRERVVTGKVLLKDYNYRTPDETLTAESQINEAMPGLLYEYGSHFKDGAEGERLARVRNEEIECQRRVLYGDSDCPALQAGHTFTLEGHYRADLNGDYLVTRVHHRAQQEASVLGSGAPEGEAYRNEFTCIPAGVPYRPPRVTPVPRIPGVMTARTETAGGDYAYIDEDGRYRTKMHFDVGELTDGQATRPIRLNQPYSGPGYAIHFPNHAGTEMVWACVDGNPDRPLGIGTIPNPSNRAPATAENNFQNVIRTMAGSQVILDDTIGKEKITINTPALNRMVFNDEDRHIHVETTEGHLMTFDDQNQVIRVKTKDGHLLQLDDRNRFIQAVSKDGHFLTIDDAGRQIVITDASGDNFFQIDIGNQKLVIKTAQGDIDLHAPNGHIDIQARSLTSTTTGDTKVKAANITTEADLDHKMTATNITEEARASLELKGLTVTSEATTAHATKGLNVTSEAKALHGIKGTMTNVEAQGILTVQGTLVKIN